MTNILNKLIITGVVSCPCGGQIISNSGKVMGSFLKGILVCWTCGKEYNAQKAFEQRQPLQNVVFQQETKKTDLASCPFCGNDKLRVSEGVGEYWVNCDNCNSSSALRSTEEGATEAWNRRTETVRRCDNCKNLHDFSFIEYRRYICTLNDEYDVKPDFYCKSWAKR